MTRIVLFLANLGLNSVETFLKNVPFRGTLSIHLGRSSCFWEVVVFAWGLVGISTFDRNANLWNFTDAAPERSERSSQWLSATGVACACCFVRSLTFPPLTFSNLPPEPSPLTLSKPSLTFSDLL